MCKFFVGKRKGKNHVETQTRHAAHVRDMQNAGQKREGKGPLERSRRNWKYALNIDRKKIGYDAVDCVHLSGQSPVTGTSSHCP
jgi:hypothetical protein